MQKRWDDDDLGFPAAKRKGGGDTFQEVLGRRLARRSFLKRALSGLPLLAIPALAGKPQAAKAASSDSLSFEPIAADTGDSIRVPAGYGQEVLLRWGDPLTSYAPEFNPLFQTPEAQRQQFGYNCDFLGFFPLPFGSNSSNSGLITVNHEFVNPELMFRNHMSDAPSRNEVDVQITAHGVSIVEIRRDASGFGAFRRDGWGYVRGSHFNRRIHGETEILITGPAAGADLLKTSADPTGTLARGSFNDCGGGITPWGTLLFAEENFQGYFGNVSMVPAGKVRDNHDRHGIRDRSRYGWEIYHSRFDLAIEPNEPFRFGWIVEVDPYDPLFTPRKRTALGRFKHEAATIRVAADGRVAAYSGDDERFEHLYKFVSAGVYDPQNRAANLQLLDSGTLHVARFHDDGTGEWIPLVFGDGPLIPENGFESPVDILVGTRFAADAVGATPMDRPEDVEANPVTGKVYLTLTGNTRRGEDATDAANPRGPNPFGHILEITEDGNDSAARTFTWEIFILCGDPKDPDAGTFFAGFDQSQVSAVANPDSIAFDRNGNLWIATDGQPGTIEVNDGIYAVPTAGEARGFLRQFLSGVKGCEVSSLIFNRANDALFVAVQHPGEGGTFEEPVSSWPDRLQPPRPSVVVAFKTRGSPYTVGT